MSRYKFSGHETFQCRHFWLKKGYDFVKSGETFKSNEALVMLGVGKNMITSISHWMKAFQVADNETGELTEFGHYVFGKEGKDPYLEDIGTLFLLHYNIMTNPQQASIYQMTFEEFRKTRIDSEFTAELLFDFITRKLKKEQEAFSEKSLQNDIKVFLRTYETSSKRGSKSIEDDFSSVLIELDLIDPIQNTFINGEQVYRIQYNERDDLDKLIYLYAILDQFEGSKSVSVKEIQSAVSDKFLCNREGTEEKLNALSEAGYVVYKQDAGRKEVQLKNKLSKWDVLNKYYGNV